MPEREEAREQQAAGKTEVGNTVSDIIYLIERPVPSA